jgi:hypothetical protein
MAADGKSFVGLGSSRVDDIGLECLRADVASGRLADPNAHFRREGGTLLVQVPQHAVLRG